MLLDTRLAKVLIQARNMRYVPTFLTFTPRRPHLQLIETEETININGPTENFCVKKYCVHLHICSLLYSIY